MEDQGNQANTADTSATGLSADQLQASTINTPEVPATSGPVQPVMPPPVLVPKKSKKKLLIGLVVLAILLVGGGALAAYTYLNNKPEKVLADALANTASDLTEKKPSAMIGTLTFESKGDSPVKIAVKFDSKASGENGQGSADVTVDFSGKTYNVKASGVVFGEEEFYFKIENLKKTIATLIGNQPEFATYSQLVDPIVAKIDNRWIKVTKADLQELGMADEQTVDKCTTALQNLKLSKDDTKQLKKLFKQNQFIVAGETFKAEKVGDEDSFHYKLDFNNQAAENFAKQVIAMPSLSGVKTDCGIDEKDITDGFKKEDSTASKTETKPVVELWVGKKSRRPTKFKVSANDKDVTVDFTTQVNLNARDISIEKPTSSVSVDELKAEFEKIVPSASSNVSGFENL